MASEFTPLVQALKEKFPTGATAFFTREGAKPTRSDAPLFTPVANAPQGTGETAFFAAAATPKPHQPVQVETKRDGDRITQIRITCGCGELIEINCEY
ncbi:MAG TPA: hypothetical protein VF773_10175 [Verrucomicrobiae bacterium]